MLLRLHGGLPTWRPKRMVSDKHLQSSFSWFFIQYMQSRFYYQMYWIFYNFFTGQQNNQGGVPPPPPGIGNCKY